MAQNQQIQPYKLGLITYYRASSVFFTGNPQITYFHNLKNLINQEGKSQNNKNLYVNFPRHTHFYTDTDTIELEVNEKEYFYDLSKTKSRTAGEIIYKLILETKFVPEQIILHCNLSEYLIELNESNIIHTDDKGNKFIEIPLKKSYINCISLCHDNSFTSKIIIPLIPNNEIFNKIFLHYRYAILDTTERRAQFHSFNKINIKQITNINNNDKNIKYFELEDFIESDSGIFIIKNKIIYNVEIEFDDLPDYIIIEFGEIKKILTKEELLFYNNIYDNTITKIGEKTRILIPIFFKSEILLYDTIELKITTNCKSKLSYKYKYVSNHLIDNIRVKRHYIIINTIVHKKIDYEDIKLDLDDFNFHLKELWFDGEYDNDPILNLEHLGKYRFEKVHLKKINHITCFKKIINNYNLISFCINSHSDLQGEFLMPPNSYIEFDNINTKIGIIDIYGIGYEIIEYKCVDDKLHCSYKDDY